MTQADRIDAVIDLSCQLMAVAADSEEPMEVLLAAATAHLVNICIAGSGNDMERAAAMFNDMTARGLKTIRNRREQEAGGPPPMTDAIHSAAPGFNDTVMRTATGRAINLAYLPETFDVRKEIAEPLARTRRFAGQCPVPYVTAERCCHGSDAIRAEVPGWGGWLVALYFLLHDDHEAVAGDGTRPFVKLAELLSPGVQVGAAIEKAKRHVSGGIHRAVGLAWPPPAAAAAIVKDMDDRMLAEELRRLWPPGSPDAFPDHPPVDVPAWRGLAPGEIVPWSAARAADEWMARFEVLTRGMA